MNSLSTLFIKIPLRFLFCLTTLFVGQNTYYAQAITFSVTGAPQTYTVPPCVTSLTFTVAGAKGGGPNGGNGAVVTATIAVVPGQVITLNVGGSGGVITGGYGGGGNGRNANSTPNASFGGGGASSVIINGLPVVIAAGGGGVGGGTLDAAGGAGGCATGSPGGAGFAGTAPGGTQFSGGAGGTAYGSGSVGGAGSLGQGGLGALDPCFNYAPGGGGGGGYYGGGGGGSDCFSSAPYGGGGGGGGSSLIPAGAGCNPGSNNGTGYITISGVAAPITPTFAAIPAICSGATFPTLPTTSLNAITGTWSPAPNNLATTTYTFTPSGPCPGATATLTVVINPNVTPTFTQIAPICDGGTLNPLPTTSTNGITGTWSPAPNNLATTTYTFAPTLGLCAVSTTMTIVVNPNITPTFNPVAPVCIGSVMTPLPTTSTNGINGTWLPALDNTATTTYTFLFTAGQCATTGNITITVNPLITPTFNPVAAICSGGTLTALPTTSTNGITGTWSPALNNTATTTYTFTPTAGLCSSNTTLSIVVNPNILPTFTQVAPICTGAVLAPLPTTSTNGIVGTWSPAPNNTATTVYTFSPTSGICSLTQTMSISVNPNITPTFAAIAPICSGATLNALPTTSTNGIAGSWSPAPNNIATTTYTFTPTPIAGSCNLIANITVTVNPNISPTFAAVSPICSGATLNALPTTSTNGITGTWSPALDNTATTTYTFTPTAGLCAAPTTLTIVVNPNITPTFNSVAPICSGAALSALPTVSTNGITGTWSPALVNTLTTSYTFTPTVGLCAVTANTSIVVNPNITPTFNPVSPICPGEALTPLPTTSNNGITGTWSPALNNMATTTYTFTPTSGLCATNASITITVNPNITPTFAVIPPICSGATLNPLPTTSINSIVGSWSPAPNNLATTTYTFTPTSIAGACNATTTLSVTVNPNITPNFTQIAPICIGQNLSAFPTLSTNGINGTWSPAPNSLATTTYNFMPNAGQCALPTTMTVTINPLPTPSFTFVQQEGCVPIQATFTNTTPGNNAYYWQFGNGDNSIAQDPAVTFNYEGCFDVTLTAISSLGCSSTISFNDTICLTPAPQALFTSTLGSLSENNLTNIFQNHSQNANWFSWDFGNNTEAVIAYEGSYTYPNLSGAEYVVTLTAMNDIGCSHQYSVTYGFEEQLIYFVPNTFTPDGDEHNQHFLPVFTSGFNPYTYSLKIFNRWGEQLFESRDTSVGWNGSYNSAVVPDGIYTWTIEVDSKKAYDRKQISGVVNVLR